MPPPWRIRDYAWNIRDRQWEYEIVERIRQTGAIDASSFSDMIAGEYPIAPAGWEAVEKHAAKANRLHSAYLDDASIAKRAAKRQLLKQQMEEVKAEWRAYEEGKGPRPTWGDPHVEEKRQAQRKADEEAAIRRQVARAEREAKARAEHEAWERELQQRALARAERQGKEKDELDRMLATMRGRAPDMEGFLAEERRILNSKWTCTVCGGKSYIERKSPGYQLTCLSCGKTAWGSHKALWEVLSK
jgi:DNA repair exonuclease SbcCD ATPase subunit